MLKAGRAIVLLLIVLGPAALAGCTHVGDTVAHDARVTRGVPPRVAQTLVKPRTPQPMRSASIQANRGQLVLGIGY